MKKTADYHKITLRSLFFKGGCALFFALLGAGVLWLSRKFPDVATRFLRPFGVKVMSFLSKVFSFTSYSVVEILLYLLIIAVLLTVFIAVIRLFREKKRLLRLLNLVVSLLLVASFLFCMFEGLYGVSYAAESKIPAGITQRKHTSQELSDLCTLLVTSANELREGKQYSSSPLSHEAFTATAKEVAAILSDYTGETQAAPKYILASPLMSYTNLTGVFAPFTGEANCNANDISYAVPFTMAHEILHRWGVNPEDEANALAFLALYQSSNGDRYRYSACYMGLLYTLPKLYKADKELYSSVTALMSEEVRSDYNAYSEFWKQYEGKTAEVTGNVNNSYLKFQGESDGTASYGGVTDWLLAFQDAGLLG